MKLLVTGAGGQVGRELMQAAPGMGFAVEGHVHATLDIADTDAVTEAVAGARPAVVVNAAAYTAVDKAESETARADAVNRDGAANLAAACAAIGAPLIHISTDYVYDGEKPTPYVEDDPVRPLGAYGRSKEAGERAVRAALDRHLILRTSWVYAAHGQNFVRTMLRLGAERDQLRVVDDQHGAPTAAADIAAAILSIAGRMREGKPVAWGTYHYTAAGETTWCGFARAIFDLSAAATGRRPSVEPIPTSAYPTPARRPKNSRLDCTRIASALTPPRRPWRAGLAEVVAALVAAGEGRPKS
jgi:dTDP-4-dehydrorhamnose reductase